MAKIETADHIVARIRADCEANRNRMDTGACKVNGGPERQSRPDRQNWYICERHAGHHGPHAWLNDPDLVQWLGSREADVCTAEPMARNGRCQRFAGHTGPHSNAFAEWVDRPAAFPRMTFAEAMAALAPNADGSMELVGAWQSPAVRRALAPR